MSLVTLQNNDLYFELSPEMGASVTKFKDKKSGKDIFRPFPKTKKINRKNCYFSGYFLTVPYFGAIHKKTFLYQKKYISLPRTHPLEPDTIHGEGWVNKWKIKKKSKTFVELNFYHNGKTGFPHKYLVLQKFSLLKTSLKIFVQIKNIDSSPFECGIGFHPWFHIGNNSKISSNSFSYIQNAKNNFKRKKLTKNKFLDLNKYKIDETFLGWNGKSKLELNDDIILEINNKKNVKNLHVYTPPGENFFCIEPVTNVRDSFYLKKYSKEYNGLKNLQKNKKFEAEVEFKLVR